MPAVKVTLLIPTSEKNLSIGPTEGEGLGLVLVEEVVLVEELEEEVVDTNVDEVLLDSDDADEELLTEEMEPALVALCSQSFQRRIPKKSKTSLIRYVWRSL